MSDRDVTININGKDNASRVIGTVGRSFDGFVSRLQTVRSAIGIIAGGAVVGKLTSSLMETAEMMDEVGKASDRLGLGTEQLIGLKWAASQSGVEFEALDKSLTKMSRNLSEVASGGAKGAADALAELGLSAKELKALTPDQQFGKIADALNRVTNAGDKIRLVSDIFGKAGPDLLNLLNEGSEGFKRFFDEAERMGTLFSREDAARMEVFNDEVERLTHSIGSLKIALSSLVAEDLTFGITAAADALNGKTASFKEILDEAYRSSIRLTTSGGMSLPSEIINFFTGAGAQPHPNAYLQSTPAQLDQTAAALAAVDKQAKFEADSREQQKAASRAAMGRLGSLFGFGDESAEKVPATMEDAKKARDEVLNIFGGLKTGVGDIVGSVSNTGMEIGTSLVKGIEVGWDASQQRIADRIKGLTSDLRTPIEVYRDGLAEVDKLSKLGLDPTTADRQRKALLKDFMGATPGSEPTQLAAREFRALRRAPGASSPELEAAKQQSKLLTTANAIADKQLKELTLIGRDIRDIRDQQPAAAEFD